MTAYEVQQELAKYASDADAINVQRYFKTAAGEYGEGDQFLGIRMPVVREVCSKFSDLPIIEIDKLLSSPLHEHRLAALIIMVLQSKSKHSSKELKKDLYNLYLRRTDRINNWDLVDVSCHDVVGGYLLDKPRSPLYLLAKSRSIWERRIAIVSTWEFIRRGDLADTILISEMLLPDKHDLIHKASGWMLREAGKRNEQVLLDFLDKHAHEMPRTMLRYSLERLTPEQKIYYMKLKEA